MKPVLDPAPTGKPHDWQYGKIQQMKGIITLAYPPSWKNPLVSQTAPRDQDFRGTCVGQSTAHYFDLLYMMITHDLPTDADKAQFKKNVVDSLGTTHDVLYPKSSSAEAFYQISRSIGNVTYPSGSEIRYSLRAWKDYGANIESQWHTDKKGTLVWMYPPGARTTPDGGISQSEASAFASAHRSEGYAMCGTPDGGATWEEICNAIYTKGAVLGAIPVYENYGEMQGGDGSFPDPKGNIVGFHALLFYGYDDQNIYLLHSWGDWCGRYGKISKDYFIACQDQSVWMVALDSTEVIIGSKLSHPVSITSNVLTQIHVDSVLAGNTPITVSCDIGRTYTIGATADGYLAQNRMVDDSVSQINFTLEPSPQPQKSWLQKLIDWIKRLLKWT